MATWTSGIGRVHDAWGRCFWFAVVELGHAHVPVQLYSNILVFGPAHQKSWICLGLKKLRRNLLSRWLSKNLLTEEPCLHGRTLRYLLHWFQSWQAMFFLVKHVRLWLFITELNDRTCMSYGWQAGFPFLTAYFARDTFWQFVAFCTTTACRCPRTMLFMTSVKLQAPSSQNAWSHQCPAAQIPRNLHELGDLSRCPHLPQHRTSHMSLSAAPAMLPTCALVWGESEHNTTFLGLLSQALRVKAFGVKSFGS